MSRFLQLHILTTYPPSNLNRDDTGRPKSALMGDATRLRVSSQSQKRAWRTSDEFESAMAGHVGTRTKLMGIKIFKSLRDLKVVEKSARDWAKKIAGCFGKLKSDKKTDGDEALQIEQLAHFSPEEEAAIDALVRACAKRESEPKKEELLLLSKPKNAVDIAMFGRMLADAPSFNVEAAVQVAHAITVHKAAAEDDYFSAVDHLNTKGAGHIGERGFGAGLYYLYVCVDRALLLENLGGNTDLKSRSLDALLHAITKVSPTGMQNSFASRAYAGYVLAEKGNQQPRTLAQAFLKPIRPFPDEDMFEKAVGALQRRRDNFDKVYGACATERYVLNVEADKDNGSLTELIAFARA